MKNVSIANGDSQIRQFEGSYAANDFWECEHNQQLFAGVIQLTETEFEPRVWQAAWKQVSTNNGPPWPPNWACPWPLTRPAPASCDTCAKSCGELLN